MIREGWGVRQGVFVVPPLIMPHATHRCATPCCGAFCHAAPCHQRNTPPRAALYDAIVQALLPLV